MTGQEIRKCRKAMGLTQAGLAEAVGITPNAVALAERGERGISEPLARLVKILVKIHKRQLVPLRSKRKKRNR